MLNPLIIAYPFLHESDACGRIEQQFFSRLPQEDFSSTIVCSELRCDGKYGEGFNKIVIPESKLICNLSRAAHRLKISDYLFLPDYQKLAWNKKVLSQLENEVKSGKYDYVHTINMPCSSHLIGLELKKKYGIPWVAQFYDPWYNNPYRQQQRSIVHSRDAKYEKEVAINADLILHSNQLMIDDWSQTYGEIINNKIFVLPYIIDEREICTRTDDSDFLTISHIGNLMRGRNSVVFIKAVAKLVSQYSDLQNRLRVNYVGTITEAEEALIRQEGLDGVFNITGRITNVECNKYFAESDAFLAIDTEHLHNVFFPSKLLNYFYYQKPIIGLCQKESVLRMELKASNNFVFDYDDVDGLAEFLMKVVNGKRKLAVNDKSYWEKFSTKTVIGQYMKLIKNLCI